MANTQIEVYDGWDMFFFSYMGVESFLYFFLVISPIIQHSV